MAVTNSGPPGPPQFVREAFSPLTLDLDAFWADLLSGDPGRIRGVLEPLEREGREAVLLHLRRMATEEGWSEGQCARARAALRALGEMFPPTDRA